MKPNITADQICSEFYFQYFSVVKKKFIKRDGVEYTKARSDPKMQLAFELIATMINENSIDYIDYINNTFNHYNKYIHPKTLVNVGNLRRYGLVLEERKEAKRLVGIYELIVKSIRFVSLYCKMNELADVNQFFRFCVDNDLLGGFFISGSLSRYYLSMFNNIGDIARRFQPDVQQTLKDGVLTKQKQLNQDARKAILTVTGNKKISIIEVTNHNINKIIGE